MNKKITYFLQVDQRKNYFPTETDEVIGLKIGKFTSFRAVGCLVLRHTAKSSIDDYEVNLFLYIKVSQVKLPVWFSMSERNTNYHGRLQG